MVLRIKSAIGDVISNGRYFRIRIASFLNRPLPTHIAFIPHGGMYGNSYDLRNYKSDNSLALLIYMINRYGAKFSYRLACDCRQVYDIEDDIKKRFSDIDIACVPFFGVSKYPSLAYKELMRCRFIFTCEGYKLPFKRSWHKVVFLSYFKPFKDDYRLHHLMMKENYDNLFDICISPSAIYSNIVAHTYNVSFSKFVSLGFSRDDMLLSDYDCPQLEKVIREAVDYDVNKVFLYTPTHRDYECQSTEKRELLGFKVDKNRIEQFLSKNGILIICKIHTHQNSSVLEENKIKGIIVHNATEDYGLCELLQRADCLITDYTSTYFDYILLNRPVLFNFYDYDIYEKTRGFSYDPLDSILAGEVFKDEESFYKVIRNVIDGVDNNMEKRKFVRDLIHKYVDTNSSKRICDFIFG